MTSSTLASVSSQKYQLSLQTHCINCSSSTSVLSFIRDAAARNESWETFNADSLPDYFKDGLQALRTHVDKLADLSRPRKAEEDKNLWFMVESLIQARHLLDEMRADSEGKPPHA